MRISSFHPSRGIYRLFRWERSGRLYERFFGIKKWKGWLPDCGDFFGPGFKKKHLQSRDPGYLAQFSRETCRAELAHWMTMAGVPVFLIWNEWWVEPIMIGYAFLANLPCILVQRFNRARLLRILEARKESDR